MKCFDNVFIASHRESIVYAGFQRLQVSPVKIIVKKKILIKVLIKMFLSNDIKEFTLYNSLLSANHDRILQTSTYNGLQPLSNDKLHKNFNDNRSRSSSGSFKFRCKA